MNELLNILNSLNFDMGKMSERKQILDTLYSFCKENSFTCEYYWQDDSFLINKKRFLKQNSLKWFVFEEVEEV